MVRLLLVLLFFSSSLLVCSLASFSTTCSLDKVPESIPSDLDGLAYLGVRGEVHLHGEYFFNFSVGEYSSSTATINFSLSEPSSLRVYVAPHDNWDIDVFLYDSSGAQRGHSSLDRYTEEVVRASALPTGAYFIRLNALALDDQEDRACETLTMELAIVPTHTALSRASQFQCPAEERLPSIPATLPPLNATNANGDILGYSYDSHSAGEALVLLRSTGDGGDDGSGSTRDVRMVQSVQFTIPHADGVARFWDVRAHVSFDFLSGGSLGLLLRGPNTTWPLGNNDDLDCLREANPSARCPTAIAQRMNEKHLRFVAVPGDYTLWLYDRFGEADRTLGNCTPFGMSLHMWPLNLIESPITCEAPEIPTSLGALDVRGFVDYHERVYFDVTKPYRYISFSVKEPSLFRAFSEEHRLDIDLFLFRGKAGSGNRTTLASSNGWGRSEEEIMAQLSPGVDYHMMVEAYGEYSQKFCEQLLLKISVAPTSSLLPSDHHESGCNSVSPDLSTLANAVFFGENSYALDLSTYTYYRQRVDHQEDIFTVDFSVNEPSLIRVYVGSIFLLGDVSLSLSSSSNDDGEDQVVIVDVGEHRRDSVLLVAELFGPGTTYTLTLSTHQANSFRQVTTTELDDFPSCVRYALDIQLAPQMDAEHTACWDTVRLGDALESIRTVGMMDEVHLEGAFSFPNASDWVYTESHPIMVHSQPAQLRVYTEPYDLVDVDFKLMRGTTVLAESLSVGDEEEIVYLLQPGEEYQFAVSYYGLERLGNPGECPTFNVEFAISPQYPHHDDHDDEGRVCDQEVLPPPRVDVFNETQMALFNTRGAAAFSFTQTAQPLDHYVEMVVREDALVTAAVTYDFLSVNLVVRVLPQCNKGEECAEDPLAFGHVAYDRNVLPVVRLPAGTYRLSISEPNAQLDPLQGCVRFSLSLTAALATPSEITDEADFVDCPALPLGSDVEPNFSLDTIAGASVFSAHAIHWERPVLVNTLIKNGVVSFTLNDTASLLRVYIPPHPVVDVDVLVYQSHAGNPVLKSMLNLNGLGEEAGAVILPGGANYTLVTSYFGYSGSSLPSEEACTSYDMEFAMAPMEYVLNGLDACGDEKLPPSKIDVNSDISGTYTFPYEEGHAFSHSIEFQVISPSLGRLRADVHFDFLSSALALRLLQLEVDESTNTTVPSPLAYGRIGQGHGFIDREVFPGRYALEIHDPSSFWAVPSGSVGQDPSIGCGEFELSVSLESSDSSIVTFCDTSRTLPTDTYSDRGGSQQYGGPQAEDGSVRLYGHRLLAPAQGSRPQMEVMAPTSDSYMRVFVAGDPGTDIDFVVFNGSSPEEDGVIAYSAFVDEVESVLIELPAYDDVDGGVRDYALQMVFYDLPHEACVYYDWELAIKSVARVEAELDCPIRVPEFPPDFVSFPPGEEIDLTFDEVVVTRAFRETHVTQGVFEYSITLDVGADPVALDAWVGFDFLANDFRLDIVRPSTGSVLARGSMGAEEDRDGAVNFHSALSIELSGPEQYELHIREVVVHGVPLEDWQCHAFAFSLQGAPAAADGPLIVSVEPPSMDHLDPESDLRIQLHLSRAVGYPSRRDLKGYALSHNMFYLSTTSLRRRDRDLAETMAAQKAPSERSLVQVPPFDVFFVDESSDTIELAFSRSHFRDGQTLRLVTDVHLLQDRDGTNFSNPVGGAAEHSYTMSACACNEPHGSCVYDEQSGRPLGCECIAPYAGPNCLDCAHGYHGSGSMCVEDKKCADEPDVCNGHGTCHDEEGYLECTCDAGYSSSSDSYCNRCDWGYSGYPVCVSEIGVDESAYCHKPLIPISLNQIGLLDHLGRVHLEDEYFADVFHDSHETRFNLSLPSRLHLRAQASGRAVMVDLFRESRSSPQSEPSRTLLAQGWSSAFFGGSPRDVEASLPPSHGLEEYVLVFSFEFDPLQMAYCPGFHLQLSIVPEEEIFSHNVHQCDGTPDVLPPGFPDPQSPMHVNASTGASLGGAGYQYRLVGAVEDAEVVWSTHFTLEPPPSGHEATLRARGSTLFVKDKLALVLVVGPLSVAPESGKRTVSPSQYAGALWADSTYNGFELSTGLQPGSPSDPQLYSLVLLSLESSGQGLDGTNTSLQRCVPFDFHMSIAYDESITQDVFECLAHQFPSTFNVPEYLGTSDSPRRGIMHMESTLAARGNVITNMHVWEDSLVRATAYRVADDGKLVSSMEENDGTLLGIGRIYGNGTTELLQAAPTVFLQLAPGDYHFVVREPYEYGASTCPIVRVEMAVEPVQRLTADEDRLNPQECPDKPEEYLPQLPYPIRLPFTFNGTKDEESHSVAPETFYTFREGDVQSYRIEVDEPAILSASVTSEFLLGDLRLELHSITEEDESARSPATTREPMAVSPDEWAAMVKTEASGSELDRLAKRSLSLERGGVQQTARTRPLLPEMLMKARGGGENARRCQVNATDREDCGHAGISQEECETSGCCYAPSPVAGAPWCFRGVESAPGLDVSGVPRHNQNVLETALPRGTYELRVVREASTTEMHGLRLSCVPFHFDVAIERAAPLPELDRSSSRTATTREDGEETSSEAVALESCGEALPQTLNSIRFLESDDVLNYQSKWRIPDDRFTTTYIAMRPHKRSLLRVYTEANLVDIDLALYTAQVDGSPGVRVATAGNGFFDEEVLVATVESETAYLLQISFWRWNVDQVGPCPTFNMEIGLAPLETPAPAQCPRGGANHWPPAPPAIGLPGHQGYFYGSDRVYEKNEELYFQQVAGHPQSKTYQFHLDDFAIVLFELFYDFTQNDMVVKLQSIDTPSFVLYGSNGRNRNSLVSASVPPGSYNLTLYEPHEAATDSLGCARFNFRALILPPFKDVHARFPDDLNVLGLLGRSDHTQLARDVSLISAGTTESTSSLDVSLPSLVRVSVDPPRWAHQSPWRLLVRPKQQRDAAAPPTMVMAESLADRQGTLTVSAQLEGLSSYELALDVLAEDGSSPGQEVSRDAAGELRVVVEAVVDAQSAMSASQLPSACGDVALPRMQPDQHGFNAFVLPHASISHTTLLHGGVVAQTTFQVEYTSVIRATLGYDEAQVELHMNLSSGRYRRISEPGRNSATLYSILYKGNYTFSIWVSGNTLGSVVDGQQNVLASTKHCTAFSMRSFIDKKENFHGHADCSASDRLPSDLNSEASSGPFGGPIRDGHVNIHAENLLIRADAAYETTSFAIEQASLLSVFTDSHVGLEFVVQDQQYGTILTPVHTERSGAHTLSQRVHALYHLEDAAAYELHVAYDGAQVEAAACPTYSLDLLLAPQQATQDALHCPQNGEAPVVPSSPLPPAQSGHSDGAGVAYEFRESFFTGEYLQDHAPLDFPIAIEPDPQLRSLSASVAFSSLASGFRLELRDANDSSSAATSSLAPLTFHSGLTDLIQTLEVALRPNHAYTLHLTQPSVPHLENPENLCYPYVYDALVVPTETQLYVSSVVPGGGAGLSAYADLELYVRLSGVAVDAQGGVVDAEHPLAMSGAFQLVWAGGDTRQDAQNASATSLVADMGARGSAWRVVFSQRQLSPGARYRLALAPHTLYAPPRDGDGDDDGARAGAAVVGDEALLPGRHEYAMLTQVCGGHGTYVDGLCECAQGYAGQSCSTCASGYHAKPPSTQCVQDGGTHYTCQADSCSCYYPQGEDGECVPLGSCNDGGGQPLCTCNEFYDGPDCSRCIEGYSHWPLCSPSDQCNPPCVHGICDLNSNVCQCEKNWQGSDVCDACTPGWTGEDCSSVETPHGSGGSWSVTILLVYIVAALLGILVVAGACVWLAWYVHKRRRQRRVYNPYGMLDDEEFDPNAVFMEPLRASSSAEEHDGVLDDDFDPRAM